MLWGLEDAAQQLLLNLHHLVVQEGVHGEVRLEARLAAIGGLNRTWLAHHHEVPSVMLPDAQWQNDWCHNLKACVRMMTGCSMVSKRKHLAVSVGLKLALIAVPVLQDVAAEHVIGLPWQRDQVAAQFQDSHLWASDHHFRALQALELHLLKSQP